VRFFPTLQGIKERLLAALVFFVAMFGIVLSTPYWNGAETYSPNDKIHNFFPVVVKSNGIPKVIGWRKYDNGGRNEEPFMIEAGSRYEGDGFVLTSPRVGEMAVRWEWPDYIFWSDYSIKDGRIVPISFRMNGAYSLLLAFPAALVVTMLYGVVRRRYVAKRSIKHP
jgi:hypothetical protein